MEAPEYANDWYIAMQMHWTLDQVRALTIGERLQFYALEDGKNKARASAFNNRKR